MDNENKFPPSEDDSWLDWLADAPEEIPELEADERAASTPGFIAPEDLELEQIMQEAMSPDFITQEASEVPPVSTDSTQFFIPVVPQPEEPGHISEQPMPLWTEDAVDPLPGPDCEEDLYPEEAQDAEPQEDTDIRRKRRPERKKGYGLFGIPHLIVTVVWLAIIVAIGVTLGRLVWVAASDMLAFDKTSVTASITITPEDDLDAIANKLEKAGLIRYPQLFKVFADLKGGREEFANGTFTFNIPDESEKDDFQPVIYDYNAIIKNLNGYSSSREEVKNLLIPEGYTCAQIFSLLEENGVCTVTELEEYAANGTLKERWFLEGVQRGDKYCLEGFLFPNTYNFYKNDDPGRVLEKLLDSFDDNYTDSMKEKLKPLNDRLASMLANRGFSQEYIDAHKMTLRDVVIVASMIEKESTDGLERYKVSSVIYNRLTNPKNFPKLQIDATIIYALGGNIDPETGKIKPLTKDDLAMDHPYNTYKVEGLPPGPISNPGMASLNAALDPDETGYYFYVYDPKAGSHIFSKTVEEHQQAIESVGD